MCEKVVSYSCEVYVKDSVRDRLLGAIGGSDEELESESSPVSS